MTYHTKSARNDMYKTYQKARAMNDKNTTNQTGEIQER